MNLLTNNDINKFDKTIQSNKYMLADFNLNETYKIKEFLDINEIDK